MSETSSCHYQMYMQLGGIDSSVRSTSLKELERGILSFLWHVHYPRIYASILTNVLFFFLTLRDGNTTGNLYHQSTSFEFDTIHVLAQLQNSHWHQGWRRNEARKVFCQGCQLCRHGRNCKSCPFQSEGVSYVSLIRMLTRASVDRVYPSVPSSPPNGVHTYAIGTYSVI